MGGSYDGYVCGPFVALLEVLCLPFPCQPVIVFGVPPRGGNMTDEKLTELKTKLDNMKNEGWTAEKEKALIGDCTKEDVLRLAELDREEARPDTDPRLLQYRLASGRLFSASAMILWAREEAGPKSREELEDPEFFRWLDMHEAVRAGKIVPEKQDRDKVAAEYGEPRSDAEAAYRYQLAESCRLLRLWAEWKAGQD